MGSGADLEWSSDETLAAARLLEEANQRILALSLGATVGFGRSAAIAAETDELLRERLEGIANSIAILAEDIRSTDASFVENEYNVVGGFTSYGGCIRD